MAGKRLYGRRLVKQSEPRSADILMADVTLVIGNRNYSSWSLRAWLVLKHAGFEFETIRVPLFVDGYAQELLRYSPAGKVPVLIDGGVAIWDSLAVAEYAAERVPLLWPQERAVRAVARSLVAEMHAGFAALRNAMPMNIRASGRHVAVAAEVAADITRIQDLIAQCRATYGKRGEWLFGDYTIADAMYAPIISRFQTYGIRGSTALTDYSSVVIADPAMQEWSAAARAESETIALAEVGAE